VLTGSLLDRARASRTTAEGVRLTCARVRPHARFHARCSWERTMIESSPLSRIAFVAICGVASAACMENPNNGTTTSATTSSISFTANGLHTAPATRIDVQVQKNMGGSPTDNTNWASVATTYTDNTGQNYNDPSNLAYGWSANFQPVHAALGTSWTQGGLLRARAVVVASNGAQTPMLTFDNDDMINCFASEYGAGTDWRHIGSDCQSPFNLPPILVSTTPTPADNASPPGYLTFTGQNSDVGAYYTAIGAPATLNGATGFKTRYGFGGADEVHAIYYNNGDLGLARDMHCRGFTNHAGSFILGGGVACYVTNYAKRTGAGTPDFGNDPTTGLTDAINANNPVATVAMVYSWSILATPIANPITFMVFDGSGNLTTSAPLDRVHANTSIPNNCITCHGGSATYDPVAHKVAGATFLPFDQASFLFSSSAGWTQADQADALRKLNVLIQNTGPAAGVQDLIKGMYGGTVPTPTTGTFTDAYIPSGWTTSKASTKLYQQVVKPYCRTCHIAQDSGLPFAAYSDFNAEKVAIADMACSAHLMPHAEQTARRFWGSPARAYLVNALGINSACNP
jgi:hypothetical protein